ncbi:UDP-N-acetylmuramoyl-L-alanyl-D-glutamate--2,6-diaminopimelate ligase [Micrococcales bacterium 31B]|nr:UDP-N-acetylmuramoyl-L-alanyl-D-glutamate--2,6-diaminopimelate ligase [Micrococcales bacterium 31B]
MRPQHVAAQSLRSLLEPLAGTAALETDADISGVTLDSRGVKPGDLYAALPGATTHGAKFAAAAAGAGASAILTDAEGAALAGYLEIPIAVHPEPRAILGDLAAALYGRAADDLVMYGLTGTNGKTTTAYLVAGALAHLGQNPGLIGTNGTFVRGERLPTQRTTPEATDLHGIFALMRERGCGSVCMEVSSHALTLHRVDGMRFDVAGFTNLSQDHLDFHPTLEDYFDAKASLFTPERSRAGIVCLDDEWGARLAERIRAHYPDYPLTTYATTGSPGADGADYVASEGSSEGHAALGGTSALDFLVQDAAGHRWPGRSPLPGRHNMANATLAMLMLQVAGGCNLADAARAVAHAGQVPGRMECVNPEPPGVRTQPPVFVDFAHSPDSLTQACDTLRPLVGAGGRLLMVMGAGGDRDALKRPLMGAAAVRGADVVIITDDNPRSEAPGTIRAAVKAGAYGELEARAAAGGSLGEVVEIPGRRSAIMEAIRRATPRDVVLLAGKGSESGQEINGVTTPFDDREEGRAALAQRNT